MRKRYIPVVLLALTACTPTQLEAWTAWYARDPVAAEEFANRPEIQALLHAEQPRSVWDDLAECESNGTWHINTGTYDGGLQFLPATWNAYGGREYAQYAWQATREQQIEIAERVLNDVGWQAWPACSRRLGLR